MKELRLFLFGTTRLEYCGIPVEISLVRSQALLSYAACRGVPLTRQHLVGLLWPDHDEQYARRQLTYAIYRLNKSLKNLDETPLLINAGVDNIQINPQLLDKLWVDALTFRQSAEHLLHCPTLPQNVNKLENDLLLHQHAFLDGFPLADSEAYETWLRETRSALAILAQKAGLHLSQLYAGAQRYADALRAAETVLNVDNLNESAHRLVIRILYAMGERAAALHQFEVCRQLLMTELGTAPSTETLNLNQAVLNNQFAVAAPGTAAKPPYYALDKADLPLVGRQAESEVIEQAIARARWGKTTWITVYGPAGIGKSTLLNHAVQMGKANGLRTLHSLCQEMTLDVTYLPIIEALRPVIDGELLAGHPIWQSALEHLLPELAERQGEVLPYSPEQRFAQINALITLLETLTREQPTIWVLDNVQWADVPTLQFLTHLMRVDSLRLLVVVGFKDDPIEPSFETFHHTLVHEQSVIKLPLQPLTDEEIRQLVHYFVQTSANLTQLVERLLLETGGNPLYLIEYLRTITENHQMAGAITPDDVLTYLDAFQQGDLPLPTNLREVVRRRLRRLSAQAKEVVEAAAVYGFQFDTTRLQAIVSVSEGEFVYSIEELETRHIIQCSPQGSYEFTHPVVHRTILSGISQVRSKWLHRRIAVEIEQAMPRADERADILAQHYLLGGIPEKATEYLLLAARRAMSLYAVEQAIKYYEQALSLSSGDASTEQQIDILLCMADALKSKGDQRAAIQRCQTARALDAKRQVNPSLVIRNHLLMAESYELLRQHDDALVELACIIEHENVDVTAPNILGNAFVLKARVLQRIGTSIEVQESLLDEAFEILRAIPSPDQRGLAKLLYQKGDLAFEKGIVGESIVLIQQSIEALQKANPDPLSLIMLYNTLAYFLLHAGDWYESNRYALKALDIAQRSHNPEFIARVLHTKGEIHRYRAEWHESRATFVNGLEIGQEYQLKREMCLHLSGLGGLELAQGHPNKALPFLESAIELTRIIRERWLEVTVYLQAAQANLDLADFTTAQNQVNWVLKRTSEGDLIAFRAWADLIQGQLWGQQGLIEKAVSQFNTSRDFYERAANPLRKAETNVYLAELSKVHFPDLQRAFFEQAKEDFIRLGARFALEQLETRLS